MSTAQDLRDRASRLRQVLPPRTRATPPVDSGTRIGTIRRSATEEIRVSWNEYEGKPFINIRLWREADDGSGFWPDSRRGISIRIRELAQLGVAIADCLEQAEADVVAWCEQQPGRRIDPETLPPAPLPGQQAFDEFEDGR